MIKKQKVWNKIVDRQTGLLTKSQNKILKDTNILMLGLGGTGMNVASNLIRAGIEKITLIDFDNIDPTSFNRLPFAFDDTNNIQKVEATKTYLEKINPEVEVKVHPNIKLNHKSDKEKMIELVENHDILSWGMDEIAGRIHYTRIAHEIGQNLQKGKPAVESWAIPFHFCAWTISNCKNSQKWEDYFNLPTSKIKINEITQELLTHTTSYFFERFNSVSNLWKWKDPNLKKIWPNNKQSHRSLGAMVAGCSALHSYEIITVALDLADEPLIDAPIHYAPWMPIYDVRNNLGYEINFNTLQIRWKHPITGEFNFS